MARARRVGAFDENSQASVRIGPVTILVFVVVLCILVMATLAFSTTRANMAVTQRQASFMSDVYDNETAAQTFLSQVDASLAGGVDGLRDDLPNLVAAAQARDSEMLVQVSIEDDVLTALFETKSGRQLQIALQCSGESYEIIKWKTSVDWKEDDSATLWQG